MFGRNKNQSGNSEMQQIRDTSQSESRPFTDPQADYPTARQYRRTRAEGEKLRGGRAA